jgi:hypothetical protein
MNLKRIVFPLLFLAALMLAASASWTDRLH